MAKVAILVIISLWAGVFAKPYGVEKDSSISSFDSSPHRLTDNYLIQLYERLLQIRPAKRPQVEEDQSDQLPSGTRDSKDIVTDEASRPVVPAKKDDHQELNTLDKELLPAVDREEKKTELDTGEGKQPASKNNELEPQPKESAEVSRYDPRPEISGKVDDSKDKRGKHPEHGVGATVSSEPMPPLVQINVNVA
uniref:Uncharacterized protein n=1 Tax=Anopheles culicifacies TaxID=139723 RepID=A0A182MPX0_9DIPT